MDEFTLDFMDFVNIIYSSEEELETRMINRGTDFYNEFVVRVFIKLFVPFTKQNKNKCTDEFSSAYNREAGYS